MTSGSDNYGIQIGGSATVHAGAIAAGPSARAYARDTNVAGSAADSIEALRDAIAGLVEQLRDSPPGLEDPARLVEIAESLQLEAAKERPDTGLIRRMLRTILTAAGGVATIADAVAAIQHAVSVLF